MTFQVPCFFIAASCSAALLGLGARAMPPDAGPSSVCRGVRVPVRSGGGRRGASALVRSGSWHPGRGSKWVGGVAGTSKGGRSAWCVVRGGGETPVEMDGPAGGLMWQSPDLGEYAESLLIPIPLQTPMLLRYCQIPRAFVNAGAASPCLDSLPTHPAMPSSAISRIGYLVRYLMYVIAPLNPCRSIVTSRAPTYTGIEPLRSVRPESASPTSREIKFQPCQQLQIAS